MHCTSVVESFSDIRVLSHFLIKVISCTCALHIVLYYILH